MNQKRITVGVDIDGVLVDTSEQAFLEYCKAEKGWEVNYQALVKTGSWEQATGQTNGIGVGELFEQYITEVEDAQQPIEGAHDALRRIGEAADIYLITGRNGIVREVTEKFLRQHLPDVNYHELSMDNLHNKIVRIKEYGIRYFIDDTYREIEAVLQNQTEDTVLIPFPSFHGVHRWKEIQDERIHWLEVWAEVMERLDNEKKIEVRRKAWEEIGDVVLGSDS